MCQFEFFHKSTNFGTITIIVNFVFPCVCKFLLYLHHMMLVNVKLNQLIQENFTSRLQISLVYVLHMMAIRVFHKRTKLALLPALHFPFFCRFLLYLDHMVLVDVKLEISWKRWVNFKVADFIGLVNFEWHSQNKFGNVGILVLCMGWISPHIK